MKQSSLSLFFFSIKKKKNMEKKITFLSVKKSELKMFPA